MQMTVTSIRHYVQSVPLGEHDETQLKTNLKKY
jgi:hypothetical protein